jgi:hypothetical protein
MPRDGVIQERTFAHTGADLTSATNLENGKVMYQYDGSHHVTKRTDIAERAASSFSSVIACIVDARSTQGRDAGGIHRPTGRVPQSRRGGARCHDPQTGTEARALHPHRHSGLRPATLQIRERPRRATGSTSASPAIRVTFRCMSPRAASPTATKKRSPRQTSAKAACASSASAIWTRPRSRN